MHHFTFLPMLAVLATAFGCNDNPVNLVNSRPSITRLRADSTMITVESQTKVVCLANDPDGDSLSYEWVGLPGSVIGDGAEIIWQAPDIGAIFPLTCRVSDGNGGVDDASLNFTVLGNSSTIYKALLDSLVMSWYLNFQPIVVDSSISINLTGLYGDLSRFRDRLFGAADGLQPATYERFLEVNAEPTVPLHAYPYWNAPYNLLSMEELHSTFGDRENWISNSNGWDTYHANHPDSPMLLLMSKVALNPARNQALIDMTEMWKGYSYDYMCILTKDTRWRLRNAILILHSDFGLY